MSSREDELRLRLVELVPLLAYLTVDDPAMFDTNLSSEHAAVRRVGVSPRHNQLPTLAHPL
jgi:hypothetical protein